MARPPGIHFANIRMVNEASLDEDERRAIIIEVNGLFRAVAKRYMEMFPDAQFPLATSTFLGGDMEGHDLRCFLLNTRSQSRARRLGAPGLGEGGTTFSSNGKTVSEIYLKEFRGEVVFIGRLIFHELMHNKLELGDEMHTDFDMGFGLARDQISGGTGMGHLSDGITQKNATVMAQALFKKVAQYPGP
jgi:hypothetical protein